MRRVSAVRGALLAAMLLVLCCAAPGAAQTPDATLPSDCFDQQVMPASVLLTCADGGFIAHDLVWSGWGAAQATATGTASVNDCQPDCAHGKAHDYAVELVADQLQACKVGKPQYTAVSYRFPNGGPFPAPDHPVAFPCPKRKHAKPRIKSMKMHFSLGRANGRSFLRVRVGMRVCAVRGRSLAVLSESKRLGGRTIATGLHSFKFRQRSACQSHSFKWRLADRLAGIGTYRVTATVSDADFEVSKSVSRKSVVTD
jgi:hypothetical protein